MMKRYPPIVKQKHDPSLTLKNVACPYCGIGGQVYKEHSMTLVGGGVELTETDPNHHWFKYICKACYGHFTVEFREGIVWYTGEVDECDPRRHVLKGIPNCFENYVFNCSYCDLGLVVREDVKLESMEPVTCLATKNVNGV